MSSYRMDIRIKGTLEEVKLKLAEALKIEGFGILTEIDVQKTLKEKIGVDFKPYKILGVCNPQLAYQALSIDEDIGLLLPCKIVLKQDGDGVEVSVLYPEEIFGVAGPETMAALGDLPQVARRSLQMVLDTLENHE